MGKEHGCQERFHIVAKIGECSLTIVLSFLSFGGLGSTGKWGYECTGEDVSGLISMREHVRQMLFVNKLYNCSRAFSFSLDTYVHISALNLS